MTGRRLGIGVMGCGESAVATARGIDAAEHAQLVAVMDPDEALARDLASPYGVSWTADGADLLARSDVDALYIAAPPHLHLALTLQAAAAGKHVLCAPPMATTLSDADSMIDACARAPVVLSIAFEAQVTPALTGIRDLIAAGAIGTVIGTRLVTLADTPAGYWQTEWRASPDKAGGGVLLMGCVNDVNTLRYLTSLETTRVYAEYGTLATPVEVEDYLVATVRYTNGAVGHIEAGSCIRGGADDAGPGLRIYGSAGQITLGNPPRLFSTRDVGERPAGSWHDLESRYPPSGQGPLVEAFAAAVLEGRPPPVTAQDGRAALEVILAAYQSGLEGRPVELGAAMLGLDWRIRDIPLPEGSPPAFLFQPRGAVHG